MQNLKDLSLNVTLALVATAAVTMISLRVYEKFSAQAEPGLKSHRVQDWRNYAAVGNRIGPPAALVTVVEFSDFQCPFCRQTWEDLREMRTQYPDSLAIVFRNFPLPVHRLAADAALAAVCAARQDAFEPYQNLLFSSQDLIGRRSWKEYAGSAGLSDVGAFEACMKDRAAFALVERDRESGKKLGVVGTPTLLINDLELPGYPGSDELKRMIRSALGTGRMQSRF